MLIQFYVTFFTYFLSIFAITNAVQCMNEKNEPVDWFAVYKIPKNHKHNNQLIRDGLGYVYVTSKNVSEWIFSKYSIDHKQSIIGNTLKPFYSSEHNISYILYNDQPPNEPMKGGKGHTKGVILSDLEDGLWLIHSVPHFLPLSSHYTFSKTGTAKGQSFLCISLDLKTLNQVGTQLQFNEPQIYAEYIPESLKIKLPEIVKAASGNVVTKPHSYNEVIITSKEGANFRSFAKTKQFGKDLYHDWIAPVLKTDLLVETWPNGPGKLPSNCRSPYKVYNIASVAIKQADVIFQNTEDHSKWAVSAHYSWICIGDINRMQHQKFRGGGSVCLNSKELAEIYGRSVASIEQCLK